MIKLIIILLLSLNTLYCSEQSNKVFNIAHSYVGVTEVKPNSSPIVDKFIKHLGLKPGINWCACFVTYCLDSAKTKNMPKTPLAQRFITKKSIKSSNVLYSNMEIPKGSIVIWKRGKTIFGHVGFTNVWKGNKGTTIEGNTSPDYSNNQYNGHGVYNKKRFINPLNYFRITNFTTYE